MEDIKALRNEISKIDKQMAELFEKRMNVCAKIADHKKANGLSVKDPIREKELIEANRKNVQSTEIESYYVRFIENCIRLSCDYQSKILDGMKVSYCGVEGAFAYIAAKKMFPQAQLTAFPNFEAAFRAVENGELDCAVLPIENSYAGEVGAVMDLLFSGTLYINQVADMPIIHNLVANKGANIETIKTVISHSQALQQCDGYIRSHGYETQIYSNTAAAAKYVKESGRTDIAAVASEETAEIFGLNVLDSAINDSKNNTTRFASVSRVQNRPTVTKRREHENFILMFTVKNEAGALAHTLNIIGSHGFNMRSLRSRPMKELQWSYFFYIEAEGNVNCENGDDMLRELSAVCANLKLVGTYYDNNE